MMGTLINTAAVVAAGVVGTALGNRLPAKVRETAMHGIGLMTILIGLQMALGAIGEMLNVDRSLESLGRWVERRVEARNEAGERAAGVARGTFSRAFVTASLVFCVGPMTITGALQDGLTGDYSTLAVKSMLDTFAGLAFASTMGIGVAFAGGVVLVYQGGLTLAAAWVRDFLTEPVSAEMIATGGLLIVGIGLNLLELKRIRVSNMLPALLLAPAVTAALTGLA